MCIFSRTYRGSARYYIKLKRWTEVSKHHWLHHKWRHSTKSHLQASLWMLATAVGLWPTSYSISLWNHLYNYKLAMPCVSSQQAFRRWYYNNTKGGAFVKHVSRRWTALPIANLGVVNTTGLYIWHSITCYFYFILSHAKLDNHSWG
jgi:hypothetical protein